jgi:hypothetical protein
LGGIQPADRRETGCRPLRLDGKLNRSGASEQIGQGLFDDGILVLIAVVNLFNKGFVDDPTKAQFVKKDDLFTVHM